MHTTIRDSISEFVSGRVSALGFAPIERFDAAPERHHPAKVCKDARTVIVFGIPVSRGVLSSPEYNLYLLQRAYHTVYRQLDEIGLGLCNFIESQSRFDAAMVPSYAPLVFHEFEPWGMISLKHAAVRAGLGAFGKSGLMINPAYGALLRLGAVITSAPMDADPVNDRMPCPEKCDACQQKCRSNAFSKNGDFNKMSCLGHTIKHAVYPLALKDEQGLKHIERVINTAGHDYWLACDECLKVCPLNHPKRGAS